MKMILVHNWIIRQTSLHALLVSCFPLHNITYDYIFQAGLMNNVTPLQWLQKLENCINPRWQQSQRLGLHSTVSNAFRRLIQFYKLSGLSRMSKAQRTSKAILGFSFHSDYSYEFGKTVNFHVLIQYYKLVQGQQDLWKNMVFCSNRWYSVDD